MTDQQEPKPTEAAKEHDTASTERARRREAALRRLRKTGPSKRAAAVFGIGAVAAVAAMTVAGSLWEATTPDIDTDARPAELPAAQAFSVCPGVPMLPAGSENGADVQFSADSSDAVSALAVAAGSHPAGNIPGLSSFAAAARHDEEP